MAGPTLVTGAAGFAGSHLVDLLLASGERVVGWRRPGSARAGSRPIREDAITWQDIDLLDRSTVRETIARLRPDVVYHCAGAARVGDSWRTGAVTLETNALGTHYLLDALSRAEIPARVLVPGSALVYRASAAAIDEDHPIGTENPYALSKLAQEQLALRSMVEDGLSVLLPRPFNHVGPRQDRSFVASAFAEQIARIEAGQREPVILTGNLEGRRDFTDVRDTVRAYRMLMERGRPGRIYNICSGRARAVREVLDGLLSVARVAVTVQLDPSRLRPQDHSQLLGNPRRLREEIGWQSTIPFEQTLADLLDDWREIVGRGG